MNCGDGTVFLFSGADYLRFNIASDRVDESYPKTIQANWSGVLFNQIDAAIEY